jgi:hypothetical protein
MLAFMRRFIEIGGVRAKRLVQAVAQRVTQETLPGDSRSGIFRVQAYCHTTTKRVRASRLRQLELSRVSDVKKGVRASIEKARTRRV